MPAKIIKPVIILFLIIILIGLIFSFWSEIGSLLGLSSKKQPLTDYRGEDITINAGGKTVSIPPKIDEDVLDLLKNKLTQTGGMPLKIERKGNPLPFGIP